MKQKAKECFCSALKISDCPPNIKIYCYTFKVYTKSRTCSVYVDITCRNNEHKEDYEISLSSNGCGDLRNYFVNYEGIIKKAYSMATIHTVSLLPNTNNISYTSIVNESLRGFLPKIYPQSNLKR